MPRDAQVDRFRDFLKSQGLKLTEQRSAVLERALDARKHFSAEELFDDLRRKGISKATVYRTLALLVSAKLLEAVDLLDRGYKLYERAGDDEEHHDHLICVRCREIVEFHDARIEEAQRDVARGRGFEILHHAHRVYGICSSCGAEKRRRGGSPRRV